jgi:hypothetical protein
MRSAAGLLASPASPWSVIVELNRNHYFIIGLVLLLLGIQLRLVDSFVLNEQASKFISAQMGQTVAAASEKVSRVGGSGVITLRVVHLPTWLGYALMSIGSVLILHAMALTAPQGAHK